MVPVLYLPEELILLSPRDAIGEADDKNKHKEPKTTAGGEMGPWEQSVATSAGQGWLEKTPEQWISKVQMPRMRRRKAFAELGQSIPRWREERIQAPPRAGQEKKGGQGQQKAGREARGAGRRWHRTNSCRLAGA